MDRDGFIDEDIDAAAMAEAVGAEPEEIPSISEDELQERLAEMAATCPTGGCSGPQCASSVLVTRYAKIVRQERLLAMAASALKEFEDATEEVTLTEAFGRRLSAAHERAAAIRREVDKERKEKA